MRTRTHTNTRIQTETLEPSTYQQTGHKMILRILEPHTGSPLFYGDPLLTGQGNRRPLQST